jgi:ribosomal protein S27E
MTNEQAIKWIRAYTKMTDFTMPQIEEALDMAEKALMEQAKADEIKVGDEVRIIGSDPIYDDCDFGVCLRSMPKVKTMYVMRKDGSCGEEIKDEWYKTGRYFPQIEEVLKNMQDGEYMTKAQADREATDNDIATMRILFNADIGCLCNQGRHNDAKEMEQIRDRLMASLQADGDLISKSKLVMYLNDWRFGVAPDETTPLKEQDKRLIIASTIYDFMKVVEDMPSVAIPSSVPTGDLISRKRVVEWLENCTDDSIEHAIDSNLEFIPSAEPKTGHWIEHPEIETSTPEYLMFYECSECGNKQCFCKSDIHKKHFCNNCGAKMVEPQESEDKE